MCGRFALFAPLPVLSKEFGADLDFAVAPRYNIAPSQPVLAVRRNAAGRREFTHFSWGLVPSWTRELATARQPINARAETAAEKPSFRGPFRHHRCLLPASGFFEWRVEDGGKQPYFVRPRGGGLFALAALWDGWLGADGSEIESCAILTTGANEVMAPIHDRMPVIVPPGAFGLWLDTSVPPSSALARLLAPYPPEGMEAYPVSRLVNSPAVDREECVAPAG
jgi:putative SOS response-associated peptidase YedK